ncbi:hypothetical protein HYT92_03700 [Candidatus Pacearchaeota archaeon]|nr:hypothetical protein [Candidatus Pacearchaeota archaeon]
MNEIKVKCIRKGPGLLMNAMTDETLEGLRTGVHETKRRDIPAEEEAASKLYKDANGTVGIPVENLSACLCGAGRYVKNGTPPRQISTATATTLHSLLSIKEAFLPLSDGNGGKAAWIVDKRRGQATNKNEKNAVCIVRPRFNSWGIEFTLEIDEKEVNPETIRQLVEVAGNKIGLCDFRPTRRGPFGRFEIAEWKVNGKR